MAAVRLTAGYILKAETTESAKGLNEIRQKEKTKGNSKVWGRSH